MVLLQVESLRGLRGQVGQLERDLADSRAEADRLRAAASSTSDKGAETGAALALDQEQCRLKFQVFQLELLEKICSSKNRSLTYLLPIL